MFCAYTRPRYQVSVYRTIGPLVIIISSLFKEDNIFSMTANLPYGPPMNTDSDYYQTFFLSPLDHRTMLRLVHDLG